MSAGGGAPSSPPTALGGALGSPSAGIEPSDGGAPSAAAKLRRTPPPSALPVAMIPSSRPRAIEPACVRA